MSYATFDDYKIASASQKEGLCTLEGARQLVGWTVFSGSIYEIPFSDTPVVVSLEEDGVALTLAASAAACTAGKYYYDVTVGKVYCRLADSGNPDSSFMALVFKYFFSTSGVKLPYDLSTGIDVYWQPLLTSLSNFKLEIDNKDTQLGLAIEGTGTIKFVNDQSFWASRYDKIFFENQLISIYSWERTLPLSEVQILFRGRVTGKTYDTEAVQFQAKDVLNKLRDNFDLDTYADFSYTHSVLGSVFSRVTDSQLEAKLRLIYGKANGVVAMNVDQVLPDTTNGETEASELTGSGFLLWSGGTSIAASVTNGNATVTMGSTIVEHGVCGGDQIVFSSQPEVKYTILDCPATTTISLTENYTGTTASAAAYLLPARQRRQHNRHFKVAGHPLSEVSTTITSVSDGSTFRVASAAGLLVGDNIIVTSGSVDYDRVIESITDTNLIVVTTLISPIPIVTDVVKRPGVQKVYLDHQLLIQGTDYTVDSTNALVKLTRTVTAAGTGVCAPEFTHTKNSLWSGKITFTMSSKYVVGGANTAGSSNHPIGEMTAFTSDFRPGDYLEDHNGTWHEVQTIYGDGGMILNSAPSSNGSVENGTYKKIEWFQEGTNKLICDVRGRTANNTTTGTWLRTAPDIVYDILSDIGLSTGAFATFDDAADAVPFDVALVVPSTVEGKTTGSIRDAISSLNRSIFGVLLQNSDLDLAYSILSADKVTMVSFDRGDVIDFSILSDGSKLIKSAVVAYDVREMDFVTLAKSDRQVTHTSDIGQYILKLNREFLVTTNLVNEDDATTMASRWAFLLELVTSKLTAQIKMQGATISVSDAVEVNHPKLYERFGSDIRRRLGLTSMISRGVTKSTFTIDDLSNAFSRVATIAEASASDYTAASDSEKVSSGYITAANGLVNSEPETLGLNVIW